jgi:ABC-2 type transport system permease protein
MDDGLWHSRRGHESASYAAASTVFRLRMRWPRCWIASRTRITCANLIRIVLLADPHFTPVLRMNARHPSSHLLSASMALAVRELRRFFRQRSRIVGAIGQPIVFWIVFGAGLGGSFQAPQWADVLERPLSYQEYFLPGIAVLIVLFTAIFATISIIEDRREGFLQGVLVAPASRAAIVMGKVLGGSLLAMIQAGLFLCLGPMLFFVGLAPEIPVSITPVQGLVAGLFLTIVAVELTSIGFLIAWPMNSTQGYHAVMSIFLLPMWLLSGSFFPGSESGWLTVVIRLNPLTYGVAGLRRLLYSQSLPVGDTLPSMLMCCFVTVLTTAVVFILCVQLVQRPSVQNTV